VIPQVISEFDFPKSSARSLTVRETVKKSKASHVQPAKATWNHVSPAEVDRPARLREAGCGEAWSTYQKEEPLLSVEQGESLERIGGLVHRRHQRRDTGDQISGSAANGEARLLFRGVVHLDRTRLSILGLCHRGHDTLVVGITIMRMGMDKNEEPLDDD